MKKIGIAVLGLAVALALFFVFTSKKGEEMKNIENNESPAETITLYRESGDVFYVDGGAEKKLDDSRSSVTIHTGAQVRTLEGSAYVLFPDNSMMSIDKNTALTINYSQDSVSILQTLGNTYHRVKTLISGQQYEVRTPGTLAAVRGTSFAVSLDSKTKKTNVKVTESKVSVKKLDSTKPMKDAPVVLEEVIVEKDSQVDVPDTSTQVTRPLAPIRMQEKDTRDSGWMEKNLIIDQVTKKPEMRRPFIEKMVEQSRGEKKGITDKERMEAFRDRVRQFQEQNNIETLRDDGSTTNILTSRLAIETKVVEPVVNPVVEVRIAPTVVVPEEENLPPLDPNLSDSTDPFVREFDRRYEYWFPIYADKATLCSRVNPLTPEILKARLLAFETNYKGVVPNKEGIYTLLRAAKTYCASTDTDNRILDEIYTTSYPF
ncbi:MAG: FecR family protein [Minisyncoccia bacterium]